MGIISAVVLCHDDVIKWKHFPCNWPFVRGIHRSPAKFLHKGQWRGALMFSLISVWINDWVNNREVGNLRPHRGHYDVIVMVISRPIIFPPRHIFVRKGITWSANDTDVWHSMSSLEINGLKTMTLSKYIVAIRDDVFEQAYKDCSARNTYQGHRQIIPSHRYRGM